MARKITKLGHAVKGALGVYLAPRLAADGALNPGELTALLKSIPQGPFNTQVPLISDAVKKTFKGRLAADADVEDLADLLEALGGEPDEDDEGEEGLEDGSPKGAKDDDGEEGIASDDGPGEKLMEMLGQYNIPASDLETINQLITQLSQPEAEDAFLPKGKKPAIGKPAVSAAPANAAPMKEVPSMKPAMDRKTVDEIVNAAVLADRKNTQAHLASLYDAASQVKPFVGEINVLAFDSADAIYKLALDAHSIETKGVHPSAYRQLLQLIGAGRQTSAPTLAADTAAVQDFEKQYTHIPARA